MAGFRVSYDPFPLLPRDEPLSPREQRLIDEANKAADDRKYREWAAKEAEFEAARLRQAAADGVSDFMMGFMGGARLGNDTQSRWTRVTGYKTDNPWA